jgi:serine protease Do
LCEKENEMTALSLNDRSARLFPASGRWPRAAAAFAIGVILTAFVLVPAWAQRPMPNGFADLVDKVVPAVVNISTKQKVDVPGVEGVPDFPFPDLPEDSPFREFFERFFGQPRPGDQPAPPRTVQALGSGFVVDPSGYVVTADHVVGKATEITVILNDGSEHRAEVIGRDDKTDLALLKIDAGKPLPAVPLGDSDKVRVGDWVVAVGNPFGLGGTVTVGVISARNRVIEAGPYDDFLQLDAAINRGNSGGPSFNLGGEVIGVNTAIFSPTGTNIGIGFAIPSNIVRSVIDQLRETGKVERGWLGVQIQSVSPEIADSLGLKKPHGALVAEVTPDSPAAAAGVEQGDVIVRFAGTDIEDARGLARAVASIPADRRVDIQVWRKGKEATLSVKVGSQPGKPEAAAAEPATEPGEVQLASIGVTVAGLTPERRNRFDVPKDVSGVVVTSVKPGSPAAERDLRPGDVIVRVGQDKVVTPGDAAAELKRAKHEKRKSVLLLVSRGGSQRYVVVELGTA